MNIIAFLLTVFVIVAIPLAYFQRVQMKLNNRRPMATPVRKPGAMATRVGRM